MCLYIKKILSSYIFKEKTFSIKHHSTTQPLRNISHKVSWHLRFLANRVLFVMLRVNPCVVARHKRGEGKPSKQQSLVSGHLAGRFNKICTTRIQYVRFGSH